MKIKFIIDTQDPEQRLELKQLQSAEKMASVLWNLNQRLRNILKYSDEVANKENYPGILLAQKLLLELCEDENINIDELNN